MRRVAWSALAISRRKRGRCSPISSIALKAAGATFANVVKTNYYLRDASQVAVIREIRAKYFTKELPASTLIEVPRLANPDFLIEIEVIAVV